jgi:hypothetical protein
MFDVNNSFFRMTFITLEFKYKINNILKKRLKSLKKSLIDIFF